MGKLLFGMTVLLSLLLLISIEYDQPLWWLFLLGTWLFVTLLFSWVWMWHVKEEKKHDTRRDG